MGAYASTYLQFVVSALVTGATGFIGQALCSQLEAEGITFQAYSRSGGSLPNGQTISALDLATHHFSTQQLSGVNAIYHLAGIAHRQVAGQPYDAVNHRAALSLAEAAEAAGVRVFIYLSSVKAMGDAVTGEARGEDDRAPPGDEYGLSKWQAELALRERFKHSPMAVYVIRPALVYGLQPRGNLRLMERLVPLGLPRPPERGGRSMVSRNDLVRLMMSAAAQARPGVTTWIAADGEIYSTRRIYDAIRGATGKPRGRAWLPEFGWKALSMLADLPRGRRESTWQKLFATELYCAERARREAGWEPQDTLEQVLGAGGSDKC